MRVDVTPIRDGRGNLEPSDYTGSVMTQTADSLTIGEGRSAQRAIAASRVSKIAVSAGASRSAGARKGALIGAGIGCLLGGVAGGGTSSAIDGHSSGDVVVESAAVGAGLGLLFGAGIGALIRAERWSTIYHRSTRLTLGHSPRGGSAAGIAIRF